MRSKKQPSPPLVSCGTSKKKKGVVNNDLVYEIKRKTLESLKEASTSSMTTMGKGVCFLWRPNNYRRKLKVRSKDNSTIAKIKSAIDSTTKGQHFSRLVNSTSGFPQEKNTTIPQFPMELNFNSHTKVISIKNFMGITIQYGKETLTGIYSQNIIGGNKETFLIEADNIEDVEERLNQKKEEIRIKIDKALSSFCQMFKILLPHALPVWDRYEDWIKGEDYIDKIPRETIVHDTYFKKVYGSGIEFKNTGAEGEEPVTHMKNYIKNRAVEDIAPQIAEEISNIKDHTNLCMNEIAESIKQTQSQLKLLVESQINTQDQLTGLIVALKPPVRQEIKLEKPNYFG